MARTERVIVTLPDELVREIDTREKDRNKFIADAVRREVERLRRMELRRSLRNPHPESIELAEQGIEEWARGLPEEDADGLVDPEAGKPIRWIPGEGWVEDRS